MNVTLLIDSIVRQTTVLVARLATSAGGRPSLAHTSNQVFVDLVHELKEQGVGNKVIADMFGLALRTYHDKIRRLEETNRYAGRSLWEAVLAYIQDHETVLQSDLFQRFRNDDNLTLRGVLSDLVDNGLVFRSGRGTRSTLRAATAADVRDDEGKGVANLVWVAINRVGYASFDAIRERVAIGNDALERALNTLLADGRIREAGTADCRRFTCDECLIPEGSAHGWEAAVFDHYEAMVSALCAKVAQLGGSRPLSSREELPGLDTVGGSTFSFTVWESHPMKDEVFGVLAQARAQMAAIRQRVADYNADHTSDESDAIRVIAYVGQTAVWNSPDA
jgi:hypothetical protein